MVNQPTALIRRPSPRLNEGLVTHIGRTPVDYELAMKQWANYVEALRLCKWNIIEVPPADDCPDSVFIEDAVVMYKGTAIITRPASDSRRPEIIEVEKVVAELGYPVTRISQPGTLDGGDVLKVDDTIYVGLGGRTNAEGIAQFAAIVEPLGAKVVTVPISKVLHEFIKLEGCVTCLSVRIR